MKKNINKKRGTVLWITGISGSGKTTISKLIYKKFQKKYGPTIIFQGDELRKIFKFKDYSKLGRISNGLIFSDLINKISEQGINVIILKNTIKLNAVEYTNNLNDHLLYFESFSMFL